jgi:dTDP-glucose 4,6-dehydratase
MTVATKERHVLGPRLIPFVKNHQGHDRRCAIDVSKIERELKWKPEESSETEMHKIIERYFSNTKWVESETGAAYQQWVAINRADHNGQMEGR